MKDIQFLTIFILLLASTMLRAQAPVFQSCAGQTIKIPDVSSNDAAFWNNPAFWDGTIFSHDLADTPVNLETFVSKGCPNIPGFTAQCILSLDLDGNGSWETVVHSDSTYPAGAILLNNAGGSPGNLIPFDNRSVPALEKYRFRLKSTLVNDSVCQLKLVWIDGNGTETSPLLPYGLHRVEWRLSNACGETATCTNNLMVKDVAKPTVACINDVSLNLYGTIPTPLWASDLLQYAEDNYTPSGLIQIGIRRVGQPDGQGNTTGFPRNANGTPQFEVNFICEDALTPQLVELWAMDGGDNASHCEVTVNASDNLGYCATYLDIQNPVRVSVTDALCPGAYLEELVSFGGENYFVYYAENVLSGGELGTIKTITPTPKFLDYLDEVNTWDLVLISRHILNIELFNSPYKIIAADANKSGTVTAFDIVELRRLILGTYYELPNNDPLIFIEKNQVFPNPLNPFTEPFQNSVTIVVDSINPLIEFVGIKIGNVDNCIGWNITASASDRSVITVPDHLMQAGQEVEVSFPGNNDFYAWQMTLAMNGLEIVEIIPFNGLTSDNFGVFAENDTTYLTFSAESPQKYFNLRLRALQNGMLSSMLQISNAITPSLSYDANGAPSPITLEFTSNTTDVPVFSVNLMPNPWTTHTNLQFISEQSGTGVFTVSNALGQVIYTSKETYSAGPHNITLNRQQIPVAGTYWCRLALNGQVQVAKMVVNN